MTGKVLQYEKKVEVDRSKGSVVLPVETGNADPSRTRLIFPKPSPNALIPNEQERTDAVDAADNYLYVKQLEHAATEEDIRRGIFAGAFYMGMCAMAALMWFLGYFDVGV